MAFPSLADTFSARRPEADVVFADFLNNFNVHPDNKQVVRNINEASVIRAIKNLILTNTYERLWNPSLGGNISKYLFEDVSAFTQNNIEHGIRELITNHERRVKLVDVIVSGVPDRNMYMVTIIFSIQAVVEPIIIKIPLVRIR